jgi:hypothetical protein
VAMSRRVGCWEGMGGVEWEAIDSGPVWTTDDRCACGEERVEKVVESGEDSGSISRSNIIEEDEQLGCN